jgi:hypothetical protein
MCGWSVSASDTYFISALEAVYPTASKAEPLRLRRIKLPPQVRSIFRRSEKNKNETEGRSIKPRGFGCGRSVILQITYASGQFFQTERRMVETERLQRPLPSSYPNRPIAAEDDSAEGSVSSVPLLQAPLPLPQKFSRNSTSTNQSWSTVDAYLVRRDMARTTGESISQCEAGRWAMSWREETSFELVVNLMKFRGVDLQDLEICK